MDDQFPNPFPSTVRGSDPTRHDFSGERSHIGYAQSYELSDPPTGDYAGEPCQIIPHIHQEHRRSLYMRDRDAYELDPHPYMGSTLSYEDIETDFRQTHPRGPASVHHHTSLSGTISDRHTAYEYAHAVYSEPTLENNRYAQQSILGDVDAPTVPSPSVEKVAPHEFDTSYTEVADNGGPSILMNTNSIWTSKPYALLPAIQPWSDPGSRAPPHTGLVAVTSEANHGPPHHYDIEEVLTTNGNTESTIKKKKPPKMHQCEICYKVFPRPSALKTHMYTHNNLKPFSCVYPGCERTFTVRSNAKRHLRIHGISPDDADSMFPRSSLSDFEVNFDEPVVQDHQFCLLTAPKQLKWMPPSLSSRTNAVSLRSVPGDNESDWEDGKEDPVVEQCVRSLTIPLQPVVSSSASAESTA